MEIKISINIDDTQLYALAEYLIKQIKSTNKVIQEDHVPLLDIQERKPKKKSSKNKKKPKPKPKGIRTIEKVRELKEQGLKPKEIAAKLDLKISSVYTYFSTLNKTEQKHQEAPKKSKKIPGRIYTDVHSLPSSVQETIKSRTKVKIT